MGMRNWSVDIEKLKKNPEKFEIFKLEQLINFGLQGKKLSGKKVRLYWNKLIIDPYKRSYLKSLLWPKK